ncbi:MAG: DUF748 domain-containing protein [Alphaproteobacteria bacterium]|nr:DUF748 domain-containing protein [Alphaproteobacteria bacterium]
MTGRRRAIWGGVAALVLAALAGLAHWGPDAGLRWALNRVLHQMGWTQVAIAHADLSLFNGAIVVKSMEAGPSLGKALGIDGLDLRFRWKPLLSKRVEVERLDLAGVTVEARRVGTKIEVNGLPVAASGGAGGDSWSFDIAALALTNSTFHLSDGSFKATIAIDRFDLTDLKSWAPDQPARFRLAGRINGAPLTLSGHATPFADRPALAVTLDIARFDLGSLAELAKGAGITPPGGVLDARIKVEGEPDSLSADGRFAVAGAALAWDGGRISAERLEWTGTASLATRAVTGKSVIDNLRVITGDMTIANRRLTIDGTLMPAKAFGILPPLTGQAELVADGVSIHQPDREWLSADRIDARGIQLAAGQPATIGRIDFRMLAALAGKGAEAFPRRLESRQVGLEGLHVDPDGRVTVAAANITGALIRVTRLKTGWVGLGQGDDGGGEMPSFAVGRLRIDGRSRLEYEDRVPAEPVRLALDGLDLTAKDLDSTRPGRDSPFTLKARLGEGRITASGDIRPFADTFAGRVAVTARAIDLPVLSPYAADVLGVHLHTGQLDADIKASTDNGRLTGQLELTLTQLYVAQPDPNAKLAKQADMPIETVLDLLRDSEGRIRLTIPVKGELTNPDFDVSDAVGQAVAGALKSTVLTTLKVAFPVAALIGLVIDEAEKPRLGLEPLRFAAGSNQLEGPALEQLGTVGGLLRQRPGLKLSVCGTADTHEDWSALIRAGSLLARLQTLVGKEPATPPDTERLLALADSRAQAAKSYLVERAGIDPGRLFTCRSRVGSDKNSPPGVLLML